MPDQVSRLLIGKARSKRVPLENVTGDKLRLIEPDAESDLERLTDSFHLNLTAFGLLSFLSGCSSSIRRSGLPSSSVCRCCEPCAPAGYRLAC